MPSGQRILRREKTCSSEPETSVGCIVARQRPCTAKGFIFISMEGETRIAKVLSP
jgi:error-prone DNA polymerase